MPIAKLKKLSFCGPSAAKCRVLAALQEVGGVHLIAHNECVLEPDKSQIRHAEDAVKALKYLRRCARKRHQVCDCKEFDMPGIVAKVLDVQEQIRVFNDKRDFLSKRVADVEPWGNFHLPEAEQLAGLKLWFYIVPKRLMPQLCASDLVWHVAYRNNLYCYVVAVAADEPPAASMPVPRTHTGATPLAELRSELQQVQLALDDLQAERESLTRWIWLLSVNLAAAENRARLQQAQNCAVDKDNLFVIQAWAAEKDLEKYRQFAAQEGVALLIEDPAGGEMPPTLLTGNKQWAGGEDVVLFYQTPNYYGWDPSRVVFFSFAVFFAMILSDAGYAALFALLLALRWRRLRRSETGRRLRVLAAVTIAAALLWGVLSGVYFGVTPPHGTLLARLRVLNIEDFSTMMHVAVGAGVAHITLANLVMAWQRRGRRSSYAALGWAMLAPAAHATWYAHTAGNAWLQQAGYALLMCSALAILWCGSERPVQRPLDRVWRLADGLEQLLGVSKIFGDVMSYMRLFALGLAGASLALTFNQLAQQVYHAYSGPGLLFALLILLLGHGLNIALCVLSGVVHGLRLNFIEFYNWSVSGEGYPFKAFGKKRFVNE